MPGPSHSVFTLDGPDQIGQVVDPFELPQDNEQRGRGYTYTPAASKPKRPRKKKTTKNPLPKNPKAGQCVCRPNARLNRVIKLCYVGKKSPDGKKAGWRIVKDTDKSCARER